MDVLNISYVEIEDKLTVYTTISMMHKEVLGTFAPYHMVGFLIEFKIINFSIWSDLTYNPTKQLLKNLQSSNEMPTSTTKKTNLSTIGISDAACMKVLPSMVTGSKTKNNHHEQTIIDTILIQSFVYPYNGSTMARPLT
jgi:hypothetical protein